MPTTNVKALGLKTGLKVVPLPKTGNKAKQVGAGGGRELAKEIEGTARGLRGKQETGIRSDKER